MKDILKILTLLKKGSVNDIEMKYLKNVDMCILKYPNANLVDIGNKTVIRILRILLCDIDNNSVIRKTR